MHSKQITFNKPGLTQLNNFCPRLAKTLLIQLIFLGAIGAFVVGFFGFMHILKGINAATGSTLMVLSSGIIVLQIAHLFFCHWKSKKKKVFMDSENNPTVKGFVQIEGRVPKGFLKSPYSPSATVRFFANHATNGRFSCINPDCKNMHLLNKEGTITLGQGRNSSSLKIVFLGDVMVSKSGNPPQLDEGMQKLLKSAHVIVANVEAPVIQSATKTKRGFSLNFAMTAEYLKSLYSCNDAAQWVFSIANNHACDTSNQSEADISGILATIDGIKSEMPEAEIIGAEIGKAQPVLKMRIEDGPTIGFIAWTEVMNSDRYHFRKKIIRENDITEEALTRLKSDNDILIGFPHGNEEQSYYPLKEARDRWCKLMGSDKFDIIVGHGPHVIHPAEVVEDRILFHSIGNFCSPIGSSQTRLGCIPEIDLCYDEEGKAIYMHYKVNLLEQRGETVSLLTDMDESAAIYPENITRLRQTWGSLFAF